MLTTDCRAAGIKVYFSQPPSLPTSRVNIPNKRILEGVRGYIEDDYFYFQVLPYNIKPFDCGYQISYLPTLINGEKLPPFLIFDKDTLRFKLELDITKYQRVSLQGTYQIKMRVQLNDPDRTYDDRAVWTL